MSTASNRRGFLKAAAKACAGLAILLTFGAPDLYADVSDQETAWDKLPEAEKQELEKRFERYKSLAPEQQAELERGLEKYKALSAEDKERVNKAYARWQTFTPEQREEIKQKFAKWKELSAEEQAKVREDVKKSLAAPAK